MSSHCESWALDIDKHDVLNAFGQVSFEAVPG